MGTTQLQSTQAAGVDYQQPSRHVSPGPTTGYLDAAYDFLAMQYPDIPENLKYKNINSAYLYFYATSYPSNNYSEEYYNLPNEVALCMVNNVVLSNMSR